MSLKDIAESMGIKVDGRWSEAKIQEKIDMAKIEGDDVPHQSNTEEAVDKFQTVEWANERVKLIWEGQSPSLGVAERTGRIRAALKEKGFANFDAIHWPNPDCKKYS